MWAVFKERCGRAFGCGRSKVCESNVQQTKLRNSRMTRCFSGPNSVRRFENPVIIRIAVSYEDQRKPDSNEAAKEGWQRRKM